MSVVPTIREKLLDTAEALFAESGYHGVSVRDITSAAGVRVASINDHFGGKEMLFEAVIARRAPIVNSDRLAMLEDIHAGKGGKRTLLQIVEAFAKPLLLRSQECEGWRNYLRLAAQLSNSRSGVLLLIADHFSPVAIRFTAAISAALPALNERQGLLAYQLMVSSVMAVFSDNLRINVLSGNRHQSSDFAAYYAELVRYIAGGIQAMASTQDAPRSEHTK